MMHTARELRRLALDFNVVVLVKFVSNKRLVQHWSWAIPIKESDCCCLLACR